MASRGTRAAGTDGADFVHRERVAGHYQQSVTSKFRLKVALFLHVTLYILMLARSSEQFLDWFHIDWPPLERLNLPDPQPWEFVWLLTIIPVGAMLAAMPRNKEKQLRIAYYGLFCFGILPCVFAVGSHSLELLNYMRDPAGNDRHRRKMLLGFPLVVLQFMFVAVALQLHLFALYYAAQLSRAWDRPRATAAKLAKQDTVILNNDSPHEPKKKR